MAVQVLLVKAERTVRGVIPKGTNTVTKKTMAPARMSKVIATSDMEDGPLLCVRCCVTCRDDLPRIRYGGNLSCFEPAFGTADGP